MNVKSQSVGASGNSGKTVTIVEPDSVREKRLSKEKQRIEQYKDRVSNLIYEQIQKRRKEFAILKTTADSQR